MINSQKVFNRRMASFQCSYTPTEKQRDKKGVAVFQGRDNKGVQFDRLKAEDY